MMWEDHTFLIMLKATLALFNLDIFIGTSVNAD